MAGISFSQDITRIYDPYAVERVVDDFRRISVSGPFKVIVKQGAETGVAVSSENAVVRDAIITKVQNGILYVNLSVVKRINVKGNARLIVYISVKDIDSVSLAGAVNFLVDGKLNAEKLSIALSGASDLKGEVNTKSFIVHQSGASNMQIKGNADILEVKLSGASDLKALDLISNECIAEISGASDMRITVNQKLKATLSGASDLKFKGKPTVTEIKLSGASDVKKLD